MTREIALDTETTGLDPYSGHRIVEIGCVEMLDRIRTGKVFHCYLNPERDMPIEAERVHGLSEEFLKDKPLFAHIAKEFLDFLEDAPLVIHNAAFDMKFLNAELEKLARPAIPMTRTIDTVLLARKKFPGQPANLDALCRRFSIDLSARTKHGALLDAELLADVYLELHGGRQASMSLSSAEEKSGAGKGGDASPQSSSEQIKIPRRSFSASTEEIENHKRLLEKLKNPLWSQPA